MGRWLATITFIRTRREWLQCRAPFFYKLFRNIIADFFVSSFLRSLDSHEQYFIIVTKQEVRWYTLMQNENKSEGSWVGQSTYYFPFLVIVKYQTQRFSHTLRNTPVLKKKKKKKIDPKQKLIKDTRKIFNPRLMKQPIWRAFFFEMREFLWLYQHFVVRKIHKEKNKKKKKNSSLLIGMKSLWSVRKLKKATSWLSKNN